MEEEMEVTIDTYLTSGSNSNSNRDAVDVNDDNALTKKTVKESITQTTLSSNINENDTGVETKVVSSPKSVLEETFRSIDMKKVLTAKKTTKTVATSSNRSSSSISSTTASKENTNSTNNSLSAQKKSRKTSTTTTTTTTTTSSNSNNSNMDDKDYKDLQTNNRSSMLLLEPADILTVAHPPIDQSDIFMDAFETMTDIAVELFNKDKDSNYDTANGHDGNLSNSYLNDSFIQNSMSYLDTSMIEGFIQNMSINHDDNEKINNNDVDKNNKNNHDNGVDDTKLLDDSNITTNVDLPFDERGGKSSSSTTTTTTTSLCSISKYPHNYGSLKCDRDILQTKHSNNKSLAHDNHYNNDNNKQKQKKWDKRKIESTMKNKKKKHQEERDYFNHVGSFMEQLTKPIANVVQQSQVMLYEVITGTPYDDDDDYSSGSSYYDSDSVYGDDDDEEEEDDNSEATDHEDKIVQNNGLCKGGNSSNHHQKKQIQQYSTKNNKDGKLNHHLNKLSPNESDDEDKSNSNNTKSSANLKLFLKDVTGDGRRLKWHKTNTSSNDSSSRTAIAVKLSIQISDSDTGGDSVEPNLVWEVLADRKNRTENKHRFQDIKSFRKRLSLFDISSVQKAADSMNLSSFPYANPERSILITLHDGSIYLFEAENDGEAKLVIHGLRWISARLVFNLLAGNRNVCSEMLPMSMNNTTSSQVLSSNVMRAVTDHLVDKSIYRLSQRSEIRKKV